MSLVLAMLVAASFLNYYRSRNRWFPYPLRQLNEIFLHSVSQPWLG